MLLKSIVFPEVNFLQFFSIFLEISKILQIYLKLYFYMYIKKNDTLENYISKISRNIKRFQYLNDYSKIFNYFLHHQSCVSFRNTI